MQSSNPGGVNYNGIDAIGLNEIKVELPINLENDTTIPAGSQKITAAAGTTAAANNNNQAATLKNGSGNGSNMDSYTDDDEIEDENRNSAAM